MVHGTDSSTASQVDKADAQTPLLKRDREAAQEGDADPDAQPTQLGEDDWDADTTYNPQNWRAGFKWTLVILVSFIEFLT